MDLAPQETMETEVVETPTETTSEDSSYTFEDFIHGTPDEITEETTIQTDVPVSEGTPEEIELSLSDREFYARPEFENLEQETEWYRERFGHIDKIFDSKDGYLQEYIESTRQEALTKLDEELVGFADMYQAMKTDAQKFLLQYMPEAFEAYGISPIMDTNQLLDRVQSDLFKEFGDDYRTKIDPAQVFDPQSLTSRVWARQQELIKDYQDLNGRNKQLMDNWNKHVKDGNAPRQVSEVESERALQQQIESEYNAYFKPKLGYTREQFDDMINKGKQMPPLTLGDLEKVINFDKYLDSAYKRGLSAKGKQTLASVQQAVPRPVQQEQPSQVGESRKRELFETFMNGGIPSY